MPYCTQSDLEQRIGLSQLAALTNDIWQVAAPTGATATKTTGGSLSEVAYYYVITAISDKGETIQSSQVTDTCDASNHSIILAWSAVSTAKAYKIYRSLTTNSYVTPCLLTTTTAVTYTDTGALTLASGAPTSDSFLPNVSVITALILKADTKIDSLAGQVYTVPFATIPDIIKTISVDLACYFAFQRRPINIEMPKMWQTAYDYAMTQLEAISNMLLRLPDTATVASSESSIDTSNATDQVSFTDPNNLLSNY